MNVVVLYSGKKVEINCTEDTYDCLSCQIAKEIGVPIGSQKLIFKGKSLQSGSLSTQGLINKAKVMLIGSKSNQSDATEQTALDIIEKAIRDMEVRLDQAREEYHDYAKGFVPDDLRPAFARSLAKRLMAINDQGDRSRASLDEMSHAINASERVTERCRRLTDILDDLMETSDNLLSDVLGIASSDCAFSVD